MGRPPFEDAGVHVLYGLVGLKTHCKLSLLVRQEGDGVARYAHLGTGNYNPATAKVYTDLGLFTCDPGITKDVVDLFNLLTGRSLKKDYNQLLVAPATAKSGFRALIDREIGFARAHAAGKIGRPWIVALRGKERRLLRLHLFDARTFLVFCHGIPRRFRSFDTNIPKSSPLSKYRR